MSYYLIPIAALIIAALVLLEPNFDKNEQTGKYILWYNWNHERKYKELW